MLIPNKGNIIILTNMKARITWIIVCLLAIAQGTWAQDEPLIVKTLDALQTAVLNNNANIKLGDDITLTSEVVIEENRTITIDLNGCKLDRGLKETSATNGHVLKIISGSTLTINDSSSKGEGCITGGYTDYDTPGGAISNFGTLILNGGWIKDNICNGHGGGI